MPKSNAAISALAYHLPDRVQTNQDLEAFAPHWQMEKVASKTGIFARHIAAPEETAADLAVTAAEKIFEIYPSQRIEIDYLIFCSQSPDYILPSTACIIQNRLGLALGVGALDVNLGCSGFVYSLGLAKGLIESGQASNVLLLTADTYTKLINPQDRSVRSVFGDGAAAAVISAVEGHERLHPPVLGTDGAGANNLIVPLGGARRRSEPLQETVDESGNHRTQADLFMDGREILNFTLLRIPACVQQALDKVGWSKDEVDLVVLHQASKLVLDTLGQRMGFPAAKVWNGMAEIGNTVSATIPIALHQAAEAGRLKAGMKVMICGFGVGYSWGAQAVEWDVCVLA